MTSSVSHIIVEKFWSTLLYDVASVHWGLQAYCAALLSFLIRFTSVSTLIGPLQHFNLLLFWGFLSGCMSRFGLGFSWQTDGFTLRPNSQIKTVLIKESEQYYRDWKGSIYPVGNINMCWNILQKVQNIYTTYQLLILKSFCFSISPPQRKEPVGGENDALEIKEQKKKIEDNADATTSLPVCLGQKDHDALLAMRDQARLVSTAIQLLTSPESNCLSSSPSIFHKVCNSEAAEPCDLEKPQPHSQVRVLCFVSCCSSD